MGWSLKEYAGPGPYASPTDRTAVLRADLGSIRLASHAFGGQSTDSKADLDDDAATREFPVLKVWRFEEDASGSAKVIWAGRMMRPAVLRGQQLIDDARQYDLSWVDRNWDLTKLRVEAERPEETDVARVQWLGGYILNGSSSTVSNARKRPSTVIDVATYVPNTNTVTLPAKQISASSPWGVIDDCARASGKSWFVYVSDTGALFLFYDLPTSMALACTLSITDVEPDLDTEFPPDVHVTGRDIDGTEFLTGGAHIFSDGQLISAFDATAEGDYDVAEDTLYADAATTDEASTKLDALIDEHKVPEEQQRTRIYVPAAQAHLVRAGMMISFRSAAAGITTPTTFRISHAEHLPATTPDGLYTINLELAYPSKMRPRLQDRSRADVIAGKAISAFGGLAIAHCIQALLDSHVVAGDVDGDFTRSGASPHGAGIYGPGDEWQALVDGDPDTGAFEGGSVESSNLELTFDIARMCSGVRVIQETLAFSADIGGPGKHCADSWQVETSPDLVSAFTVVATVSGYQEDTTVSFGAHSVRRIMIRGLSSPYNGGGTSNPWSVYAMVPFFESGECYQEDE